MSLPANIEFHNIPSAELSPNGVGWILPRYPRQVYETFPSPGFMTAQESTGVELRFVTAAPHLRVFLCPLERATEVTVFRGDFLHFSQTLTPGVVQCVHLTPPDHFASIRPEALHLAFHPDVWRVLFCRGTMVFHGIDSFGYSIRPPFASEKPAVRWLAYGSSITHSSRQGYPQCAARLLGVDVQNKGMSGSCFIDDAAVDFIADGCEWDIATLEIGINMRMQYPVDEFERRARNLVARCRSAKPGRPIVLITMFRNAADHLIEPDERTSRQVAFDEILRVIARENRERNVHLIEGTAIVDDLSVLSSDFLHPTDNGHARMAENLAGYLKPLVESISNPTPKSQKIHVPVHS
ncbi:MAG: GDSL-type esterase/lipase family protein [Luteolibacter sp.]